VYLGALNINKPSHVVKECLLCRFYIDAKGLKLFIIFFDGVAEFE